MRLFRRLTAILLAVGIAHPATARLACAKVRLAEYSVCRYTPSGLILSDTPANADWGRAVALGVERKFGRYFGAVPRYVFMIKDGDATFSKELEAAGFRRQFKWTSPQAGAARTSNALAAALREKYQGEGLPEAQIAASIEQVLGNQAKDDLARQASTAAHELGHDLLQHFWDGRTPAYQYRYGTLGPDWLDEIAAILMESEDSRASRRQLLGEMYRRGEMLPLRTYLEMTHPNLPPEPAREFGQSTKPEPGNQASIIEPADPDLVPEYYAQSLGFAEFLMAQSARPRVFESIARNLAEGSTFEQWLAAEGPKHRLGSDVAQLTRQWEAWLLKSHGDNPKEPA